MKIDEIITAYIDENANFVIINRASYYFPEFVEQKKNVLYYSCKGSQRRPYRIKIQFDQKLNIKTSCSCPYDGYGICKHQVASLESLRDLNYKEDIDLDLLIPLPQKEKGPLMLKHENGVIDSDALSKIQFSRNNYHFGEIKFTSVKKHEIEANFETFYDTITQTFKYDKSKKEISLNCNCGGSKNCFHKYLFLDQFKDVFGLDYFSEDYENKIKQNILEDYNLKGKIDFDEAFNLIISTEGPTYSEKFNNIISTPQLVLPALNNEEVKTLHQPHKDIENNAYGLGFCFQFFDGLLYRIFPFYGKLNKAGTRIITKIREIDDSNLYESMQLLKSEDVLKLTDLIKYSTQFDAIKNETVDYQSIANLVRQTQDFIKTFNSATYIHNSKNSLAKKFLHHIHFSDKMFTPILSINENKKFYELKFKVRIDNTTYNLNSEKLDITPIGIFAKSQLFTTNSPETLIALLKLRQMPEMSIYNEGIEHLKSQVIEPYSKIFEISFNGLKEKSTKKKDFKPVKQVYLSDAEQGKYVVFQPVVKYAEKMVTPMTAEKVWLDEKKLISLKRDYVLEDELLLFMQNLHPEFEDKIDYFYILTEQALESLWLMEAIEKLKAENIQVFGLKELKGIKYNLHKPTFNTRLSSGTDWFDMKVDIAFGDQKVDLRKLQKAIVKNSNYVELGDGSLGIIPRQWIEKYKKYFKLGQTKKDHIEISNYNFNIIDELYEDLDHSPDFLKDLHARRERILNLKDLKPIKPSKHLTAQLRPYQKEGLNWLVFLHDNTLGGCLADDMGLGKTLQSIAFLQYLKDQKSKKQNVPSLVVSPTSLIFNWINEFEKFAPQLKTLTFTGPKREELKDHFSEVDVVMTTYGSLIKDIQFHKTQTYNYVILDESQAIKNPNSQRFKAVRLLNAYNRLALTGTPIENNTFDLYSQFNFINPGIFGSIKHFRSTFSDAIDKEQDEYSSELLSKIIKPFILRRTKAQVAKELPNKTESVIYCEMGKQQRKVYDQFKNYFREKLKEQIENEGINRSQVYILQGLTKLRQICNSTALADKDKDYGNYSAKLDELTRHLTEKVNNHKVLVFSQFVGMLDLVKSRLDAENITYEYLDGKTKDRESKVNRFQNDDEVRVFLISLKAGGTGLNLTEAEYVYLIDPWWNPAVENQAIDRCYRIGQDNHVFAYRMICKDTIEERIVELQDRKKTVASEVIRTDVDKKSFDQKDLEKFFGV
jgi:non-specific serine/threonine protein kinase